MDETLNPLENANESIANPTLGAADANSIANDATEKPDRSRLKLVLKRVSWISLGTACLLFFTILKLPEDKIQGYVQGLITSQLSSQGINLSAAKSSFSIGWGISYTMNDVTVNFPAPQPAVHIDQISVSPSLLSIFTGKVGAAIRVENKSGELKISFSSPMNGPSGPISLNFHAEQMDLGSLGVLSSLGGLHGSALLNGEGEISGDTSMPQTLNGKITADLNKIVIDQQNLMGFSIPRLTVSDGKADIVVEKGKAQIKTLRLGKTANPADDIRATVSGDVILGKVLSYSTLDLKANFTLSQNVMKAFVLLDAVLGGAKQADGSYSYTITGSLNSPNPIPVAGAAPVNPTPAPPTGTGTTAQPGH